MGCIRVKVSKFLKESKFLRERDRQRERELNIINTAQILMLNGENLVRARFKSGALFNITIKFHKNIIKPQIIDIY